MSRGTRRLTSDELALWHHVTRSITPLRPEDAPPAPPPTPQPPAPPKEALPVAPRDPPPPPPVVSAGRVGSRLGKVSELTIIVPFAPGGADRLRAFLQLFGGNLAGADAVFDAVFRQCGVYRAATMEEFFEVGYAAATRPPPSDARVGLVTVSGGVGVLMADHAAARGLDVSHVGLVVNFELPDTPEVRGMINRVKHLVEVEEPK